MYYNVNDFVNGIINTTITSFSENNQKFKMPYQLSDVNPIRIHFSVKKNIISLRFKSSLIGFVETPTRNLPIYHASRNSNEKSQFATFSENSIKVFTLISVVCKWLKIWYALVFQRQFNNSRLLHALIKLYWYVNYQRS